jgi:hypothetical protein
MIENNKNSFIRKTAIILLLSTTILELFSVLGLSTSVVPRILRLETWTSYSIITLNLAGVLGIIKLKGIYLSILASVFWMIFSIFSLFEVYEGVFSIDSIISSFVNVMFGFFSIISVFKINKNEIIEDSEGKEDVFFTKNTGSSKYAIQTSNIKKSYFLLL